MIRHRNPGTDLYPDILGNVLGPKFQAQDFTSKIKVKINACEVNIRAYEVKSCAYEVKIRA